MFPELDSQPLKKTGHTSQPKGSMRMKSVQKARELMMPVR
jgi:hypothetical protein